ncbi:MAG: FKBP-type peptidyl-prolyl cis-trans isomerase [Sedimenticola sp.]
MQISKDKIVTIEYKMVDVDGTVIDSSDDSDPLSFIQGREAVFPALEAQVEGKSTGSRLAFTLEPKQTYGERDEKLVRVIPRDHFDLEGDISVGMTFAAKKDGRRQPVTVTAVSEDELTVDANHPLAGVTMSVDVVIVDVRDAVEDELATGLVQNMDEIYSRQQKQDGVPVKGLL